MGLFSKLFKKSNSDPSTQGTLNPSDPVAPAPTDQAVPTDVTAPTPVETPAPTTEQPVVEAPAAPPAEEQSTDQQNPSNPA